MNEVRSSCLLVPDPPLWPMLLQLADRGWHA